MPVGCNRAAINNIGVVTLEKRASVMVARANNDLASFRGGPTLDILKELGDEAVLGQRVQCRGSRYGVAIAAQGKALIVRYEKNDVFFDCMDGTSSINRKQNDGRDKPS